MLEATLTCVRGGKPENDMEQPDTLMSDCEENPIEADREPAKPTKLYDMTMEMFGLSNAI